VAREYLWHPNSKRIAELKFEIIWSLIEEEGIDLAMSTAEIVSNKLQVLPVMTITTRLRFQLIKNQIRLLYVTVDTIIRHAYRISILICSGAVSSAADVFLDALLKNIYSVTSLSRVCDPFDIQEHSLI
jgi:hypothetical protein